MTLDFFSKRVCQLPATNSQQQSITHTKRYRALFIFADVTDQMDFQISCLYLGSAEKLFHHGTWYIGSTCVILMNKGLEASVPCTTILFWISNKRGVQRVY